MMNKTYAYLRVSTDKQDLANQRLEIEKYAASRQIEISDWIRVAISSRKSLKQRRAIELIEKLKKGDRVIVSEISRLARSVREVHNLVYEISRRKAELHAVKQNLVTKGEGDLATKIYIAAFAMSSEIERDLISQRTRSGLARAKAEGKVLGNPNLKTDNQKRAEKANQEAEKLRTIVTSLIRDGHSQRKIVAELNAAGIRTSKGSTFKLMTLQRVLKRLCSRVSS
jgi:DNA invertase Pin-like site-specific DNA recombinase